MDNDYNVIVVKGSLYASWFRDAPAGSPMGMLYERMLADQSLFAKDFDDAKEKLKVRLMYSL